MLPVPAEACAELQALYEQLALELEPFRRQCNSRGVCCRFAAVGHMLYVTGLEAAVMLQSGVIPDDAQAKDGSCPFLRGQQCGIREHRALGCRLYYCDSTYKEDRNVLYERFMKTIREIEARYGIEHWYEAVTTADLGAAVSK